MATRYSVIDCREVLSHLVGKPIFVNNLDNRTKEGRLRIKSLLYSTFSDGEIDVTKTCPCGELQGLENVGKICDTCGGAVINSTDIIPENRLWYQKPNYLLGIFNTAAWMMLSKHLTVDGVNLVAWFCDRTRKLVLKDSNYELQQRIESIPFERGFNSFIQNFDDIMSLMIIPKVIVNVGEREKFIAWIKAYRHLIFTDLIPLQDKSFLLLEKTGPAKWATKSSDQGVDAIYTLIDTQNGIYDTNESQIEKRLVSFYEMQSEFIKTTFTNMLGKKPGLYRKTFYGDNLSFSARGVVTSNTKAHAFDEIIIPWGMGIRLLYLHIGLLMYKWHKLNASQIREKIEKAISIYDSDIDDAIKYIILNSPGGVLELLIVRYPTIYRGSVLLVKCRVVNNDPHVMTIIAGIMLCKLLNMDMIINVRFTRKSEVIILLTAGNS